MDILLLFQNYVNTFLRGLGPENTWRDSSVQFVTRIRKKAAAPGLLLGAAAVCSLRIKQF